MLALTAPGNATVAHVAMAGPRATAAAELPLAGSRRLEELGARAMAELHTFKARARRRGEAATGSLEHMLAFCSAQAQAPGAGEVSKLA